MAVVAMKQLLEAGVHFGRRRPLQSRLWKQAHRARLFETAP